jgi:hypothetical protein
MAVARAQGQGGVSGIVIWLIAFVALWLTTTVFLFIVYIDFNKQKAVMEEARDELAKVISLDGKRLPQFALAKDGKGTTMVDLIETERGDVAELISGSRADTASAMRTKINETLERIRANQYVEDPSLFEGVTLTAALDSMFTVFRQEAQAREELESKLADLATQMETLRTAQEGQREAFEKQAEEMKAQVASIEADRDKYRQDRNSEIDAFDDRLEAIRAECSNDIQAQRSENNRLRTEYDELFDRYQELKDKIGQSQVAPLPLATARRGDGSVMKATPGDEVVYIDLGSRDHLTLGLTFAVYDSLKGIPEDGRAKARIEVVRIFDQSAECRIVDTMTRDSIMPGDIIANPIYDRHRTLRFFVMGEFDLNGDGRGDPDGRQRIESLVKKWGGQVEEELTAQVDFVSLGGPPERPDRGPDANVEDDTAYQNAQRAYEEFKKREANVESLAIPRLTQSVLLNFLGYTPDHTRAIGSLLSD